MVGADVNQPSHNLRLITAYEAALTVAQEVTPEAVLQRIVELARELVRARYAALGVSDDNGRIEQFITSGLTPEERASIGALPEGQGLLGELIHQRAPLLIPDIAADPRSVGFPPNHPPMKTLLGVPILLGNRVLGNLYLTERTDGDPFNEDDLAALRILATHAALAIDRAHAYRAAERQRDQLRTILDHLPVGVLILAAPDAHIELINAVAIGMVFGTPSVPGVVPLYGRDYRLRRADGTPLLQAQRPSVRALNGEASNNQQLLLESADGRRIPVLAHAAPLPGGARAVERAVLVLHDITRLREAEQLKDDFLSLISHELRTPLTAIHGGAHLLSEHRTALDKQTKQELISDIVTESDRLERMLANILNLAAVMAGRLAANTEPVLLPPLAHEAVAHVSKQGSLHTFRIDMPPDLPPAEGDPALLVQVLTNLYENAVKYTPQGGKILTVGSSDGEIVSIAVIDTGIGMAPDQVELVFERFHRAGNDPTVRGMGLGLYLSRCLIEAMGGTISAHSPGPGLGSTFAVTLPVAHGWKESGPAQHLAVEKEQGWCASQ